MKNWWRILKTSLRWRLVLVFLLLGGVMAMAFVGGAVHTAQSYVANGWNIAGKPLLNDYLDRLVEEVGTPPSPQRAAEIVRRLPITISIDGPSVNWQSHANTDNRPKRLRDRPPAIEQFWQRSTADGHVIRFNFNFSLWQRPDDGLNWGLIFVALTTLIAFWYIRRLLKPIEQIQSGVAQFGHGEFSHRIALPRAQQTAEMRGLAEAVNDMASEIESMLDAKRQLLLAISHELRSPLTRARLHAELLPVDDPEDASLRALLANLSEINSLIEDLVESERLNGRHAVLTKQLMPLDTLIEDVISQSPEPERLRYTPTESPQHATIDPVRVRLLMRNLLLNALRYGAPEPVDVSLQSLGQDAVITVRDYGPGVADAELAQLSQAFYRPDSARSRDKGGVGLGLYLCRLVVEAHGGEIQFANASPGLRVTVRLPLDQ
ncbi:MAG: HAMP domain-containing histidine kinase [Gammaproteobacteria bacterium]|nr:HAMP domain-containing histidine kinase [Gammaproteobacteria bacterium]